MASYPVGDVVRLSASFTASGVATDPTTVTLYIKGGTVGLLQYTYAAAQITKDSTGNYHVDYTTTASGSFSYRWEATGAVIAAAEGSFVAGPSAFK